MKIFSDQIVKTGEGICDFCGKEVNNGILGKNLGVKKLVIDPEKKYYKVDKQPKGLLFSIGYKVENYSVEWEAKEVDIGMKPIICKECVKEFSKMIK